MAETPVNVTNLATGIPIAADLATTPTTTAYVQQIQVLAGSAGTIIPIPGGPAGLMVQFSSPQSVIVSGSALISGTVSVSGAVQVSGAISVSAMPAVSGTVSVLGSVAVAVSITGTTAGSAQALQGSTASLASGVFGAIVRIADSAAVSGTVSVSGTVVATLATGGTIASVLGTVNVTVAGTAIVSVVPGVSVSIGGLANVVVTTTATSGVSGPIVWLGVNQTLATLQTLLGTVGVTVLGGPSVTIQQGASVSLGSFATVVATTTATSGVTGPIVWLGVNQTLATVQTLVTVLGTVAVNVVAGGAGGGSVTTAPPSISASGQIFWVAGGQSSTADPVWISQIGGVMSTVATVLGTVAVNVVAGGAGGGSVTTAPPSISASGQIFWVAGGQSSTADPVWVSQIGGVISTVATVLGTVAVNVVAGGAGGGSVTTAPPSISASGQIFWVAGGQSSTADPVWVSQIGGVISTVATVLGTVAVNVVAGGAGGGSVTTAPPSISASGQIFWVAGGQSSTADPVWVSQIGGTIATVLTIVTQLGTQIVSIVPGPSVTIQQGASVSLGSLATVVATTTATSGVTGPIVWLGVGQTLATVQTIGTVLGTVQVSGSILVGGLAGGYMLAVATTTAVSSSTQVLLQSVYVSTGSTLGTSGWTVGAGSALMVYGLAFGWSQAAANNQATFMLLVTNTGTTLSTVTPAWAQVTFTTAAALSTVISAGFYPGTAVGINTSITTIPFPWVIPGPAVIGMAVAATSSGATVYASINAEVVNTIPVPNIIAGTANVSGTVVVSGAIAGVTTQTAVTGAPVWLAPTQTINVSIVAGAGGGGSVTTAPPSISASGQLMWMAGGQSTTANPVFVSQINPPAAGGGSVVTTQAGGTSTGQLMWLAATQTLASISTIGTLLGTVNIGGSVAISGTGLVSIVPGPSVTIQQGASVSLPAFSGVTAASTAQTSNVFAVPVLIINGQTGTATPVMVTVTSTALVSIVAGASISTLGGTVVVTLATGGTVATLLGTVQISGTVNVSSTVAACIVAMPPALLTNSGPSASAQGLVQWVAGGQSSSLWPIFISTANPLVGGDLQAVATTTAISSSTQVLLQSVFVNGIVPGSTLGTSGWTIGAGSALMVYGLGFGWSQAAANMQATFMLLATTSGTTLSTVSPAFAQVTFTTAAALSTVISSGFVPGTYRGLNSSLTTIPLPWVIQGPAVVGFAVAATSSGATVYVTVNAQVVNTIPDGIIIAPGQSVSLAGVTPVTTQTSVSVSGWPVWWNQTAQVAVSGAVSAVTSQLNTTGAAVWLAPTQTITVTVAAGTVALSAGLVSTTQPPSGVTGLKVWPGQPVNIPVMIMVTSTAAAISANAYLMTVWTGSTVAAAGTSLYVVPAGQNLRLINNLGIVTTSAVVGGTVQMVIAFGTNAASLVSGSVRTQGMALLNQIVVASTNAVSANVAGQADIGAGATIAPFIIASTAAVLQNMVVNGFLI